MTKIVSTGETLSTEKYLERKKRARRKRQLFALSSLLILFILVAIISRLERFRISNVTVAGANVVGAETVSEFARDILEGHYLWLIPKDNALIYPGGELKRAMMRKIPRFSSVNFSLEGLQHLHIDVVEREPFALYCGAVITTEGSSCYFLDESGFIFDSAPAFSDGVYFVYASSESMENPSGRQFLPEDEFKNVVQFIETLPSLGITPLTLKLDQDHFDLTFGQDSHLLLPRSADMSVILSNLESFLKNETISTQTDFLSKVKELDLRTENKVFFRF